MQNFTLIVKPVGNNCPLNCSYCYTNDPHLSFNHSSSRMSEYVVEAMISKFMLLKQPRHTIIWHGGEPTLAGIDFYERVLEIERIIREKIGVQAIIEHKIQTNGVLIDDVWAAFFKRTSIKPGISLDGPRNIQNANRSYKNGGGSFDDVMQGIMCLEANKVHYGIGAVINKKSLEDPVGIFEFFTNHFSSFDFSPCFEANQPWVEAVYAISADEYANFIINVFDEWWKLDDPSIRIESLSNLIFAVTNQRLKDCSLRRGGCENFLGVDSDGSVYPCGRSIGISNLRLGNLMESDFHELRGHPAYLAFLQEMYKLSSDCLDCRWLSVCNNGCTSMRYLPDGSYLNKYPLCDGYKRILDHVASAVSSTMSSCY